MFAHKADAYAEQGNVKGIERCAVAYPLALGFLLRFPIVFAAIYLGADVVEQLLDVIPEWLTHGLDVYKRQMRYSVPLKVKTTLLC